MGKPIEEFQFAISKEIRSHALSLPESDEGTSCVNRAFKAGGKNFAFLGEKDEECKLRLKLDNSIPEIQKRAKKEPARWEVGVHGWTTLRIAPDEPPEMEDLARWITESFLLLAPKKVSRLLEQ